MAKSVGTYLFNALRGGLIGVSEALPGISGGTVALIVGIYDALITSAGHVVSGIRLAVTDLPRGRGMRRASEEFRKADWGVIAPALAGMAVALVFAAVLIAPLVEQHTRYAYAIFFGLVLACLWIPYTGAGRTWRARHYLLALAVAAAAFALTGLPGANLDPTPVTVALGASVAVCALVLPGMSGSFILLTLGLYQPTLDAVGNRDFGYLAVFALGMVVGLSLFVKLLQWLLENHHHLTLVVLTGLMAGSLRALWPWQDEYRNPLPLEDVPTTVALAAAGFAVVVAAIVYERRVRARRQAAPRGRHAAPAGGVR